MKCTRECKFCKNIFQPKRVDSFFCSESCRSKNYRFERFKYVQQHQIKCAVLHCESFAYKTNMCNAHYSKTMYKPKKEFLINCIFCKKEFYTKRTNTKFCSTNCAQTFRARLNGVEPKKLIATCVCKQCNVEYKPKKGDRTTFCSRECSLKYMTVHGKTKFYKISLDNAKQRRKKRIKNNGYETINKIKVFDRDNWRCHICGCKTPKEKKGTYEMNAPELDHIVPLAAGGSHTYANVSCACKRCNIKKSSRSFGQLNFGII